MIQVGDTLHVDHGNWLNGPTSFSYLFYRADKNGENPVLIVGPQASPDYIVQSDDFGSRILPAVIATNTVGDSDAVFGQLSEIVGSPFVGGTPAGLQPWQYGEPMPAWLRVNGTELANWGRTLEYLRAGLAGPGVTLQVYDACPVLYEDDNGGALTFTDPVSDPAPWHDAGRQESGQFLGVIVNDVSVAPQQSRAATSLPGRFGGTALGPITSGGMTITVSATLVAASASGLDYGEEWLRGMLADPGCDLCGTDTVEVRRTCPPADGSNPQLGYWLAYNAGVTAEPVFGARDPAGHQWDVSWTWTSQDAYLYKLPTTGIPPEILNPDDVPGGPCIDFTDWFCGPGHNLWCATVQPPTTGVWGTILTINSPDGVGEILIATYVNCPPDLVNDIPVSQLLVTGLLGTLVIDSSQHLVTYISPDGSEVRDGTDHLYVPAGQPFDWIEVQDCDLAKCVCISTPHPCSGGGNTTVQLDLQYRRG